ncbi:MAG: hypothetical protein ACTHJ3_05110 [Pararhizobium sp.]
MTMHIVGIASYRSRRERLEQRIQELIDLLDAIDGDCDLEPDHAGFDRRFMDDREGDDERNCDLAGASSDLEYDPSWYGDADLIIEGGQGL